MGLPVTVGWPKTSLGLSLQAAGPGRDREHVGRAGQARAATGLCMGNLKQRQGDFWAPDSSASVAWDCGSRLNRVLTLPLTRSGYSPSLSISSLYHFLQDMQEVRAMEDQERMQEGRGGLAKRRSEGSPGRKASQSCVPVGQKHMPWGPPWWSSGQGFTL